jgi:hypothetical protein
MPARIKRYLDWINDSKLGPPYWAQSKSQVCAERPPRLARSKIETAYLISPRCI